VAVSESSHEAAKAVESLYRQHGGEVYRYAFAVLGNHADAEDVTQSTFLNAYRSLEQGVHPRKPANWLLTIASNTIKERFRREQARPRQVVLDDEIAGSSADDDLGPTVGELLTALSRIPPQQRQAIVLREFEGRSYKEVANILSVTTSALETLLFRARRSLAEELEHRLTCTDAQAAVSRAADGRIGRKERRRLREHLAECPDCAHFARLQQRHRRALKGLMLVPIPLSLSLFKSLEGTATAATAPAAAGAGAVAVGAGVGAGSVATATGGGVFAGGVALKAAAVVAAASVAGGAAAVGTTNVEQRILGNAPAPAREDRPGERVGQVAPRGVNVPGRGVAVGKEKNAARNAKQRATAAKTNAQTKAGSRGVDVKAGGQGGKASSKPSTPPGSPIRAKGKATRPERSTGTSGTKRHGNPAARPQAKPRTAGKPEDARPHGAARAKNAAGSRTP